MRTRSNAVMILLCGAGVACAVSLFYATETPVAAQGQQGRVAAYTARTRDGRPNLTGLWQSLSTAYRNLQNHEAEPSPFFQLGAIGATPAGQGVVDGNEIPYLPAAAAKKQQNFRDRWSLDPELRCYLPGIPRAMYMPYPFQIIHGNNEILMAFPFASSDRVVHMTTPRKAVVDSWMGTSNGRWEGDTLVIDNTGFNDSTWFDRAGNFHSDKLHVVERIRPITADALNYEATIEDPEVFARPWKITLVLYRRLEANQLLPEYKCVPFAEELVFGYLRKYPTR